jgi:hypothetical protein
MQRGQLLRDIAMKRGQVEAEYKAGRAAQPSDWDLYVDSRVAGIESLSGSASGGAFSEFTSPGASGGGGVTKR